VAANLKQGHQQPKYRHNSQIKSRPEFQVGDMVWVMKPKPIGGHKTQTYWEGPTTIISRSGQNSFTIITKEGDSRKVHAAQLKPYYDDMLEGGAQLHFYRPEYQETASGTPWYTKYSLM
jgi:hypothetical protein